MSSNLDDEIKVRKDPDMTHISGRILFLDAVLTGLLMPLKPYWKDIFILKSKCIILQSKAYFHNNQPEKALEYLTDDNRKFIIAQLEQRYSSDSTEILKALSSIRLSTIRAQMMLKQPISETFDSILNTIRSLCVCAGAERDRLAANLYMCDLGDLLLINGYLKEALTVYKELFEVLPIEDFKNTEIRNYAMVAFGHYVQCALLEESMSDKEKEDLCLKEVKLFK